MSRPGVGQLFLKGPDYKYFGLWGLWGKSQRYYIGIHNHLKCIHLEMYNPSWLLDRLELANPSPDSRTVITR